MMKKYKLADDYLKLKFCYDKIEDARWCAFLSGFEKAKELLADKMNLYSPDILDLGHEEIEDEKVIPKII